MTWMGFTGLFFKAGRLKPDDSEGDVDSYYVTTVDAAGNGQRLQLVTGSADSAESQ